MKSALIMFAAIAAVQCGITRQVRNAGWPSTTPAPTPGWPAQTTPTQGWGNPTTQPPSTQGWGWSTTTQGWAAPPSGWAPPPSGWAAPSSVSSSIELNAALAAAGQGWAAENHADNVQVTGAGGWGPSAQLEISSNGASLLAQDGSIIQVTSQDNQSALSLNNNSVGQIAAAEESQVVNASGLDISNAQNGWAGASGEGASAADATSHINVQSVAANLGLSNQ